VASSAVGPPQTRREGLIAVRPSADETITGVERALTRRSLLAAVRDLSARDRVLAASVERFGPPPLWARAPGFSTLIHFVLEQQVSLASAQAAFDRLAGRLGTVTPAGLLTLDDRELRAMGFSRQKAAYGRALAAALADGFDLDGLANQSDDEVRSSLTTLHGVGRWTADVYLTMCLLRPDVWPHGDQALAAAAMEVAGLDTRPTFDELERIAEPWRPYRAVAARILWHHYLRVRAFPVD
jgi:DNA-3-methyladenine glycosylase II